MAVVVKIPTQLRAATGGVSEASVEGATVQEVLDGLFDRYAELRERIADERRRRCAASSTCTWPAKTSASWTASPPPSRTARS